MVSPTPAQAEASSTKDAILEAVAHAAERLLSSSNWREAASEVLERLGVAAGVERAYVLRNFVDDQGYLAAECAAEWSPPGFPGVGEDPEFANAAWEDSPFGSWAGQLRSGRIMWGQVDELSPPQTDALLRHGVASILILPITIDGEWWGVIGFDSTKPRAWANWEVDALRTVAGLFGSAVMRWGVYERIRKAERRYRQLLELIPAVTYTDIPDGDTAELGFLSPQIEALLGYPVEQFKADPEFWISLIHPDDRRDLEARNAFDVHDVKPFDEEYRMIASDGREVWVHDRSTAMFDEDGEVEYFLGFALDVTERHRAEEELRQSEERARAIVERTPAIVYSEEYREQSYAPETTVMYVSPAIERILGYSPEDWSRPGRWMSATHPDDLEAVIAESARVVRTGKPYRQEYRMIAADGRIVWIHDEAVLIRDKHGNPVHWQGVMLDVTERKLAERQLREAEEQFRTIVEQSEAIFYIQEMDPQNPAVLVTKYIAPGNEQLIGYTPEEVQNEPTLWRRLVHPEDRGRVFAEDGRSDLEGRERFSLEYRMIAKDGRIVWVQDEARLVQIGERPPQWQGFLLDITERKKAEARLERALAVERAASRRLRDLDEMKNTFLQAVSHDLRTPLAAIIGLALTLERPDVRLDDSDARDLAHRIAGNARKLDRLVMNLLDMDRLARGIVAPKLQPTDVAALVRRVVAESDLDGDRRLRIDIQPVLAAVDAAKVERIVENLLANTLRHAPPNATIWVGLHPDEGGFLLLVEDNGPGVPAHRREEIFEPFKRGTGRGDPLPGVGVGLTLVRRFAELHGGRAWVEDRRGGGASFRVWLPG